MRKLSRASFLLAIFMCMAVAGLTQPMPPGPDNGPADPEIMSGQPLPGGQHGMQPGGMRPGMPQGMRPGMQGMRPGMRPGGQKDPEMEKKHAQRNALMAMAEAHKELAAIYEQQNKIDEAAAELKKIITLANTEVGDTAADPGINQMIMNKIMPVYHEIARLYIKNDRLADAEKVINEGITLFEKDNPAAATRLILQLGEIYKRSNNLEKAEATFKRVIELNQKNIK